MKALRMTGLAYDKIAEQLNIEGLKPRTGMKWYPGGVRRILLPQSILTYPAETPTEAPTE